MDKFKASQKLIAKNSSAFLNMEASRALLISIHPRFANLILSGEKKVEFRRTWIKNSIDFLVIYATAPVQCVVGVAKIKNVAHASPSELWKLSRENAGLSQTELYSYFRGKKLGYAVELSKIWTLSKPVDPFTLLPDFRPPQSFKYLDQEELISLSLVRGAN